MLASLARQGLELASSIMRIPSKSDQAEQAEQPKAPIPSEVQIWLDKGWTIISSERRGYVISGDKKMRSLDRIGLVIGFVLLAGFFMGFFLPGTLGVILIIGALLDFQFNTKAPTKFFPEPGEKPRFMERG